MPGLAPWLQEAPVTAQVHARHRAGVQRQIELLSAEVDFRVEHELPALLRGRQRVVRNLRQAVTRLEAAGHAGVTLLRNDLASAVAQLAADEATVKTALAASREAVSISAVAGDACSVGASAASEEEWAEAQADLATTREALELLASEEAAAIASLPHEPLEADAGGVSAGTEPGIVRDAAAADYDIFPRDGAPRNLCLVEGLEEAQSGELHSETVVITSEAGISEHLFGEDFRSLLPGCLLTSPVVNVHTVLLQVSLVPLPSLAPSCR